LLPAAPAHAASVRSNPTRSTAPDRQIDDGFQMISLKVQHTSPAYKSRPGLFTRQGQIEVPGSGRLGPWDSKTSSSREVSRDSQRLRR